MDGFVRQELAKLSTSARILKDAVTDTAQIRIELCPEAIEFINETAQNRGVTLNEFAKDALRKALYEESAPEVSEAETYFIAEALRHSKLKLDADDTDLFLRGFLEALRPDHPARAGLERILGAHEDRDERIESLQIGQYLTAAA